ncbi:MAG: hypothetical protein ACOYOP_14510 [Microthrixaceae bacterium]
MGILRRLLAAYLGFRIAEFGVWIGLAAAAYTAGGVREATAVMVLQLAPAAALAPTVGGLVGRWGATTVLRAGLLVQAAGMAWAAAWFATGGDGMVRIVAYAGAVVAATAVTTTRPCLACLLPRVVADEDALARTNGVVGGLDGLGMLLGPVLAAVLLAAGDVAAVFTVMAAVVLTGAALTGGAPAGVAAGCSVTRPRDVLGELRSVLAVPSVGVLTAVLALIALLIGALDLAYVVTAVDLLGMPASTAAWLNAAFGMGMVAGGAVLGAASRRRLGRWVLAGLLGWAAALGLLAARADLWVAVALLGGAGVGATCAEVASRTLLQRVAGLSLLGHAFSVVEGSQMAALGVGAVTVGLAVDRFGPQAALVAPAVLLVGLSALIGPAVLRSEGRATRPVALGPTA